MIPPSSILVTIEILTIDSAVFITVCVFIGISMVLLFTILSANAFYYRELIKNTSWKLNLIMCSGCGLMYIAMILFGVDEQFSNINYPALCNFRIWLIIISFTIIFMPLFFKTYRISKNIYIMD
jgi:hypothetical protein